MLPTSTASAPHPLLAWCVNYLLDDGATGRGACCAKDEQLAAWCKLVGVLRVCEEGGMCINYLLVDGATGRGACCAKDQQLAAWCRLVGVLRVCVGGQHVGMCINCVCCCARDEPLAAWCNSWAERF